MPEEDAAQPEVAETGTRIHPLYSVSVTPAQGPYRSAYVGQALMSDGKDFYGGVLCTVTKCNPDESNELAQYIADAWNATA